MHRPQTLAPSWAVCLLLATPWAALAAPSPVEALNERGIAFALAQQPDRAESSFVAVLSHQRGDVRATNNLGNLMLLKGDLMVALSFFDRALRSDSSDAGIRMNRATVFHLLGEEDRAVNEAAVAVQLAGGAEQAAARLGLRSIEADSSRAAEKKWLSKSDLRALLLKAAKNVPAATQRPAPTRTGTAPAVGKPANWRNGATRASDDGEAAALLYWKR